MHCFLDFYPAFLELREKDLGIYCKLGRYHALLHLTVGNQLTKNRTGNPSQISGCIHDSPGLIRTRDEITCYGALSS